MDYKASIERIYEHLENDSPYKAVMICLRIARNLQDYLYSAIFLRELYSDKKECKRILYDDISDLKQEAQKYLYEVSFEYWLNTHQLDFNISTNNNGEKLDILLISVGEIESELAQCESHISDLTVPSGMTQYDTAAFNDSYIAMKSNFRLRIKAIYIIKERIKAKCLNYAIRIERQLKAQEKSQNFLEQIYLEVNNYFKAHSEDVYVKLQKAAQLIDSNDKEDLSLLLTEVRRAMKSASDYFYPPLSNPIVCSDGETRNMDNDHYMNRLYEYITKTFDKSTAKDLLKAEYEYLNIFASKLNAIASKGVHDDVTMQEAKQGLLGLYMFLYNITSKLQENTQKK